MCGSRPDLRFVNRVWSLPVPADSVVAELAFDEWLRIAQNNVEPSVRVAPAASAVPGRMAKAAVAVGVTYFIRSSTSSSRSWVFGESLYVVLVADE